MNDAPTAPLRLAADDGLELARAELYGLLARLWLAPPDEALRQRIAGAAAPAAETPGHLHEAWHALVAAMRETTAADAAAEHDALFGGVGRPEVFVYASYHRAGFLNERPLAELRDELRRIGLTRDETRGETEDHVAYLLEVMRYLITGDDAAVCNLEQQRRFFRAQLQPWVAQLCDSVEAHPAARTWRAVAALTRRFVEVETQAFDLIDG